MWRTTLVLSAFLISLPSLAEEGTRPRSGEKPRPEIHAANRKLGRGINIGNALEAPREGAWGVTLKAEYYKAIRDAGFATVRLPVKWSGHAGKDAPYAIDATFAKRVDWAVDQALAQSLNIIVNVHHYGELDVDPDKHLPRLVGLWEQIAERYKDRPACVYFELLNEPHDKFTAEKWNAAIPKILAAVRKTNPTRPVIVGPARWNSIRGLDALQLPDDRNLILTIHFYDPFQFTHQGATFVKDAAKWKGRQWTGSDAEKTSIRKSLTQAAEWAKKRDLPVFLGEFGAYHEADMDSRVRWTGFIVTEAEKLGFSWAYWEFCSGFGAYDSKAEAWRKPLKEAMLGAPSGQGNSRN
jgi:endoglucanase